MELNRKEIIYLLVLSLIITLFCLYVFIFLMKNYTKIPAAMIPLLVTIASIYGSRFRRKIGLKPRVKSIELVIANTVILETLLLGLYLFSFFGLRKIKAPIFTQITALLIFLAMSGFFLHLHFKELKHIAEEQRSKEKQSKI